jgi:hypothetical protein
LALRGVARADDALDVGPNPVLNVQVVQGNVTVQTWDRQQIQVETDGLVRVRHLYPTQVDPRLTRQIPIGSQMIDGPNGPLLLPAESFVLPPLPGDSHDGVFVRGNGNTTITIPQSTALIIAHVGSGNVAINDYTGAFITHVHTGEVQLNHVGGTGFVEDLEGRVFASNSDFDRLRIRTGLGNMLFEHCRSNQIVATSTYGSIVYDNGVFQPGLAHFSSEHGNVALGVNGGAQIGAQSRSGQVMSSFHGETQTQVQQAPGEAQATIHGGGPLVTATSKNGSVYLYNGSIRAHPVMQRALLQGRATLPQQRYRSSYYPPPSRSRPVQPPPRSRPRTYPAPPRRF